MRHLALALTLSVLATATACAPKEEAATTDTTTPPKTSNVVQVHAADYSFHAPDTIPAGMTTFNLVNGGKTLHHLIIARLDSGKTLADLMTAMSNPAAPPPAWMVMVGGPNAPDPGKESNATLELAPGQYAMICAVDIPGHVPHFAKGMVRALTVTEPAGATGGEPPLPDIDIGLIDFKFVVSKPLTAGHHVFSVHTDATQPHEVELIRLADGKTDKDFFAWVPKMEGPPPASAIGGMAPIVKGHTAFFSADLTPGNYMLICFLPDAKDPTKMHFMKGMVQTITVP